VRNVVVVGGGYGGLACLRGLARRLDKSRYALSLVDATPYHTIKTRFHERAVLLGRDLGIRFRLDPVVAATGARFVHDEVHEVDYAGRRLVGRDGEYPYDALVLAPGGRTVYFGVPGAEEHTVSLQTYEAADRASRRVQSLGIGQRAAPRRRVVVCGAGIEGLEVAAMLRQLASPRSLEVTVVERSSEVMAQSQCKDTQRRDLHNYLERKQIGLRLGTAIAQVDADGVHLDPEGRLQTDLVYWCSGVRREVLGGVDPDAPYVVNRFLQHADHPEVFALGDFAKVNSQDPFANLGSAQRAVYQGSLVAENVWRLERGRLLRPARYRPIGELIGLGDWNGVGVIYGLPVSGRPAALAKKLNEAKYLIELFRDLPRGLARRLAQAPGASQGEER
jgi:NADH dehydrogenase